MQGTRILPELLAPAGSREALYAAVEAGADAVYLGGVAFNARINAVNFDAEAMAEAIAYCHLHGVRSYVTLNTLLYDREIEGFLDYAASLHRMGADAVIVADRGAIDLLHQHLPSLEIHASTQASVHSTDGARALAAAGAARVVLARELPLSDITSVVKNAGVETEIFLHGALCVSHSGQCLFSSLVGGRSGNRGECAQPCRLPYNGGYPLSLRDLSLADHIPALIESGVSSLKIEGRMKSAAYVYGVTTIYRRLLDERRAAGAEENRRLRELFSRGGFTDGYFCGRTEGNMTGIRSEGDKEASRALDNRTFEPKKIRATAEAAIVADEPSRFTLTLPDGRSTTVKGAIPEVARSAPLTAAAVADRLSRTGGTAIELSASDIRVSLDVGLNLSPGAINALRREALAALTAPQTVATDLPAYKPPRGDGLTLRKSALFLDPCVAKALGKERSFFDVIFLPLDKWEAAGFTPDGVYLPPVVFDRERDEIFSLLARAKEAGVRYALCGNVGMIAPLSKMGFAVVGDFRLNVTNRESARAYRAAGVSALILSPELTLPQLRDMGEGSAIVYGRIPLMLTERCFIKENFGCKECGKATLSDRRGARFPLLREYGHRNLILNSLPTYMGDRQDALSAYRVCGEHFLFTTEAEREAEAVIRAYRVGKPLSVPCRRIAK
ncbi:MAG: U32 family peptidase [Clostridia bacterium]|nr:U32 family peptidase [Clostridia bacterium]